ncbi:hypothetical protein [Microbacterium ulmi]|uniref:Uncharacterized protein n=1 Tax=Microbacterium ulmi TaxID=179095 RepID=A0A7Y2PYK3_9MICO|nr:hypothetical protein [Microbacterium ulmi]NII69666.1 hypothetical protein [Microbacterium ulmi]NNH03446.1 hypothetical protein [Microbacterium ulmi]
MLTSDGASSKRSIRSAVLPVVVSAALVIPNLFVIALGIEDFPFTTAPMFAHYVGPDTQLYTFRFEGVRDGVAEPLPIEQTNRTEREIMRQFASWYYRPMTDTAPFRDLDPASGTPEQLAARMADFFGPIADFLRDERDIDYDRIDVYVDHVDNAGALISTAQVGHYDTSTRRYTHTYEVTR